MKFQMMIVPSNDFCNLRSHLNHETSFANGLSSATDWTNTGCYLNYVVMTASKLGIDSIDHCSGRRGHYTWVRNVPCRVEAFMMMTVSAIFVFVCDMKNLIIIYD
jgi:hypothetical protein